MRTPSSAFASALLAVALLTTGCESERQERQPPTIPALGAGTHALDAVEVRVIGTSTDRLRQPRDLDFNPGNPGELWVVNRQDDSVVRFLDAGTDAQTSARRKDSYALHFMEEVSAISFSRDTMFAAGHTFSTCQESDNTYNDKVAGDSFMGPALWTSDWSLFGFPNPEAVAAVGSDLGSHIDMMHESAFCMGVAWEVGNAYWTADGGAGTISRYDFAADHGVGFDDHSDGLVQRFVDVPFVRVEDVPSHLVYDPVTATVFFNNTGTGELMQFDPAGAVELKDVSHASQDHGLFFLMSGGTLKVIADGTTAGLVQPSGLAMHERRLYVTDNATSRISAFELDGSLVDYLDTGLPAGSLMGLRVDATGSIWVVDSLGNQVLRYSAKPAPTK